MNHLLTLRWEVAWDNRLTMAHLRVLYLIGRCADARTGYAFPSMRWMAKKAGLSPARIAGVVKDLRTYGYLKVTKRPKQVGKEGRPSNAYWVNLDHPIPGVEAPSLFSETEQTTLLDGGVCSLTPSKGVNEVCSLIPSEGVNITPISNTHKTTVGVSPDDLFEQAWEAYPKRPNNSRADARKAWDKSIKKGADPHAMITGTKAYAAYVAEMGTEPQYIKLASTFFGPGQHWTSDYTIPEPKLSPADEALFAEPQWIN